MPIFIRVVKMVPVKEIQATKLSAAEGNGVAVVAIEYLFNQSCHSLFMTDGLRPYRLLLLAMLPFEAVWAEMAALVIYYDEVVTKTEWRFVKSFELDPIIPPPLLFLSELFY
jgi:hypothetical protein